MSEHPELKKLRGFIVHSEDYLQKNIAYACQKLYQRIQELKSKGENTTILESSATQWIQELDKIRQSGNVQVANKEQYYQEMKNYSLKLFLEADNEERDGSANKFTMKKFETSSRFLEALGVFGKSDNDIEDKKKYAKVKAVQIMKMLKDPQLYQQYQDRVIAEKNQQGQNLQQSQQNFQNQQPINPQMQGSVFKQIPQFLNKSNFQPTPQPTNQFPMQPPTIQPMAQFNQQAAPVQLQQYNPNLISNAPQKRVEAKKLCENAVAEIKNSRYAKAKEHILKAVNLLDNI